MQGNLWVNEGEIPFNGIDDDENGFIDDYYGFNFLNNTGNTMDGPSLPPPARRRGHHKTASPSVYCSAVQHR